MFIHPRRFVRNIVRLLWLLRLNCNAKRCNVKLIIGRNVSLNECVIRNCNHKNCCIFVSDNAGIRGVSFEFNGDDSSIIFGSGRVNACKKELSRFSCGKNSKIVVEDGFLLSNSLDVCTTDFHYVYNHCGDVINPNKDIVIGENCWIGKHVYIGKGVCLPENTVVGAYSVVTKSFEEPNTVIAGNPASVKKREITWHW